MPKLPTADTLGQRPAAQSSAAVVSYRPVTGQETAGGEAMVQAGRQLQVVGDNLWRVQQEQQEKADTLRAEDAFNQLRQKQLDLTLGEEGGFANVKGADAVKRPLFKEYNATFMEAARLIESGLENDDQKAKFRRRASAVQLQFDNDLLKHVTQERNVYRKQVFDGTLDTELRNATAHWNDPAGISQSLERVRAIVGTFASETSMAPELRDDTILRAESKIHSSVIGQALASGNTQYAQRYFEANRETIDATTAKSLMKAVEDGTQKQLANGYQALFLAARNDPRALDDLEKRVSGDGVLDDARKNVFIGRIMSQRETVERRRQAERDRWERQIDRQIAAVNTLTLQGYEPTTEQMLPLISATKGTALEGQVRQMIATADATRQFRRMLPAQQEAALSDLEAQARKDPGKVNVQAVDRLRTIYNNQRQQVREDPQSFAVRQGFVEPIPLDISKPAEMGQQLAQRMDVARTLARDYQAPVRVLTREEATALSGALRTATPQQKAQYFAGLEQATRGDRDAYSTIMGQLAPDDPVTAIAGVYAGGTSQSRRLAGDLMLRGMAILNPPQKEDGKPVGGALVKMPDDTKLMLDFTYMTRGVFVGRPKANSDFYQAARAIYAAKSAEEGAYTGEINSRRWKDAIRQATGQIESYRGKPVVLPENYDMKLFRDAIGAQARTLADSGRLDPSMTRDRLESMPLENVGDGKYVFRAGDGVLVDKNNRPVVINLMRGNQ